MWQRHKHFASLSGFSTEEARENRTSSSSTAPVIHCLVPTHVHLHEVQVSSRHLVAHFLFGEIGVSPARYPVVPIDCSVKETVDQYWRERCVLADKHERELTLTVPATNSSQARECTSAMHNPMVIED